MKVTLIDRTAGEPMTEKTRVEFIPDSALLLCGKPFFIPELPGPWAVTYYPAFRVSRLGKSIASRFAHRYYDAVAVAAKPSTPAADPVIVSAMDGGIVLGEWTPYDGQSPLEISIGETVVSLPAAQLELDTAIARLSRLMTFKMGDIVLPLRLGVQHEIEIGDHISASVQGEKSLDFNVK